MDYSREPIAISPVRAETRFLTRVYGWMATGARVGDRKRRGQMGRALV